MKKINVFDVYKVIKDSEKYGEFTEEMLEKLDEMLDEYEVDHAFSECRNEDIAKDINSTLTVMYNQKDDTKFFMIYGLFCMKYRNLDAEQMEKTMKKRAGLAEA